MRAVTVRSTHGSELETVEVREPVAAANEAVVEVHASSINRGELTLIATRARGWVPGQDVAGVVIHAAGDGTGPLFGARVAGLAEQGAWAERVSLPAHRLAEVPTKVSLEEAAALPMAGLTALRTLRLAGTLLGKNVLVTGASGAVGRLQVQLATVAGARVTAVAKDAVAAELSALGASAVVPSPNEATGAYDVVLESVGGCSLPQALSVAAPGANVVLFGASNGEKSPLNIYDFIGHENITIHTYLSYAYKGDDAADLRLLLDLTFRGLLDPGVNATFPLTSISDAVEFLTARKARGKVILQPRLKEGA